MDILAAIIDLIAPRRLSQKIVDTTTKETVLDLMQAHRVRHVTCLLPYHHPTIQALITENKFHHSRTAQTLLAHVLSHWLSTHLPHTTVWLVPIPLSRTRESNRGYNQVQIITELIAHQHPACQTVPLLTRIRDTKPQTTLGRAARLQNIEGAFALAPNSHEWLATTPDVVIIVDDVLTTGSTMSAARTTLASHLAPTTKLLTLAFAH